MSIHDIHEKITEIKEINKNEEKSKYTLFPVRGKKTPNNNIIPDIEIAEVDYKPNRIQILSHIVDTEVKRGFYRRKPSPPEPKELILISFDDINLLPVLSLPNRLSTILLGWYDKCDSLLDIYNINYKISNDLSENLLSDILYKPILKKHLEMFTEEFLPQYMKSVELLMELNKLKQIIYTDREHNLVIKKPNITLESLGIVIPTELIQKYDRYNNTDLEYKHVLVDNVTKTANYVYDLNEHLTEEELNKNSYEPLPFESWMLYKDSFRNCLDITCIEEVKEKINIMVILHTHYLQTLVIINPSIDEKIIVDNYPEYGFIELLSYKTRNTKISEYIQKEYHNATFNDIDSINETITLSAQHIKNLQNVDDSSHSKTEESIVKKHILDNYIISNEPDKRIKASTLLNIIVDFIKKNKDLLGKEHLKNITDNSFRIRLSTYLHELGLEKKRYNDGYYYYGIVKKHVDPKQELVNIGQMVLDSRIHRNFESFMKERQE